MQRVHRSPKISSMRRSMSMLSTEMGVATVFCFIEMLKNKFSVGEAAIAAG
jgi:hypothetical protein